MEWLGAASERKLAQEQAASKELVEKEVQTVLTFPLNDSCDQIRISPEDDEITRFEDLCNEN